MRAHTHTQLESNIREFSCEYGGCSCVNVRNLGELKQPLPFLSSFISLSPPVLILINLLLFFQKFGLCGKEGGGSEALGRGLWNLTGTRCYFRV